MATPPMSKSRTRRVSAAFEPASRGPKGFKHALKQQKWLTLIGLPVLLFTSLASIYTLWGVLFMIWGLTSLRTGQVYLLETIYRRDDPALFWVIVVLWIGSGGLYVLGDLFPAIWYWSL